MHRLLEIGFQPAGHWLLAGDVLKLELHRHASQKNILYAFVCDGEVKYVGKTVRTLRTRLAGYKTPGKTQITNLNNHRRIQAVLAEGAAVEILALPDNGHLRYGQFHLNLAAGLEDDIIRTLNPEWNGGMAEPVEPSVFIGAEPSMEEPEAVASFTFVLQPTYYRMGFFNVGVADQEPIGADGETIEIFLGNEAKPIQGTINRRANANGTPRIMGGTALRDWFQSAASPHRDILVEVYSAIEIRLRPETES